MRKIETIKKEIANNQAAIEKAEATIIRLEARRDSAIAKLAKAGYTYVGDGKDTMNCPNSCYTFAYTASEAEEGIQKRRDDIRSRRFGLEHLQLELQEADAKVNAIPQAIKDYQVQLEHSLITDRKFRRDFARKSIEELKDNGEWVTRDDLCRKWTELDLGHCDRHDPAWDSYRELKNRQEEQDKIQRAACVTDAAIEKSSREDAAALIMDLAQRVAGYVGTATDCSGLHVTTGTHGYSVLNGIVVGDRGRCEVVSKGVAGYNIVCWHIRVNVFPVRA